MKNRYSFIACIFIIVSIFIFRFTSENYKKDAPLVVTTWDALGYYIYLPSIFIYNDFKELEWFPEINKKYEVTGGQLYQANRCISGHYVYKYLGGVAILQSPFFLIAHVIAPSLGYKQDGFSPPYQMAIAFGAIFYFIFALFLLRYILLIYFDDIVVSITLILLILASNMVYYVAIDGAISHGFIFPLYVLILYFTIKWHDKPSTIWASCIGVTLGLATICRPTEIIMLFIPLLWATQTKTSSSEKWRKVRDNKKHIFFTVLFALISVSPQLIYWKLATGTFVYDVGSKWEFLNPHFRVLFGWENGWFVYTPIAVFFIVGMFFMEDFPFRKSVITFCLFNIYIIIAWHDWRYGATYSCRALTQSYPIFALPLAVFIDKIRFHKFFYLFATLGLYLLLVNLFQIKQYDRTIIHFRDMNRKYYSRIYLNPNPNALDMSMLDNNDWLNNENEYVKQQLLDKDSTMRIDLMQNNSFDLFNTKIEKLNSIKNIWIKIETKIKLENSWGAYIYSELRTGDSIKTNKIRTVNPLTKQGQVNDYAFYIEVPKYFYNSNFKLYISTTSPFHGELKKLNIITLINK